MKRIPIYNLLIVILLTSLVVACEDYLVRAPASTISDKEVFSNFEHYQGFVEQMYYDDFDQSHYKRFNFFLSDHALPGDKTPGASDAKASDTGLFQFFNVSNHSVVNGNNADYTIYRSGWHGIRVANQALANLDKLVDATPEERNIIEGQAYFFRGYFHWRIGKYYGGLPYVDEALEPSSDLKIPRLNWQAMADRIVQDLDKAIELLPYDWEETQVGLRTAGNNEGRATKGAAMGFKAKVLLYAGSPLMNMYSGPDSTSGFMGTGGPAEYDHAYLERAAEAAWELMQLSEDFGGSRYGLVPWNEYHTNFYSMQRKLPWTKEMLWSSNSIDRPGARGKNKKRAKTFGPASWGLGNPKNTIAPTQNLVDHFETSNGYPKDHPNANFDPTDPWSNRDPRLDYNILTDGEQHGFSPKTVADLYDGGTERRRGGHTGYLMTKFWAPGVNKWDSQSKNYIMAFPNLRLADIYLIYAEAANEVYGSNGTPSFDAGAPTAVSVINRVRNRANHVNVPAEFTTSTEQFREVIRNERVVEMCWEMANHWFDIRRWYTAHLDENKNEYGMSFNKAHTSFQRELMYERIFEKEKHYWVPFPKNTVNIYSGWQQNPGW